MAIILDAQQKGTEVSLSWSVDSTRLDFVQAYSSSEPSSNYIQCAKFLNDGKHIAFIQNESFLVFVKREGTSIAPVSICNIGQKCKYISVSPNGKYFAAISDYNPQLTLLFNDNGTISKISSHYVFGARYCAFSPCGTYLAVSSGYDGLYLFKNIDGSFTFVNRLDSLRIVGPISYSSDGKYLALTSSNNGYFLIILKQNENNLEIINTYETNTSSTSLTFSPDDKSIILTGPASQYTMMELEHNRENESISLVNCWQDGYYAQGANTSPCGNYIVSQGGPYVMLFKREDLSLLAQTRTESYCTGEPFFSSDGIFIICPSQDGLYLLKWW